MTMTVYCKRCHGLGHFDAECITDGHHRLQAAIGLAAPRKAKKKLKRPKEKRK